MPAHLLRSSELNHNAISTVVAVRGNGRINVGTAILQFDRLWRNLGVVANGSQHVTKFRVLNAGDRDVAVGTPLAECGCTAVRIDGPSRLAPGDETFVVAAVTVATPALRTRIRVPLLNISSGESQNVVLAMYANLLSEDAVVSREILFGDLDGASQTRTLEICHSELSSASYGRIEKLGFPVDACVELKTNQESHRIWRVTATVTAKGIAFGKQRGRLLLVSDVPDSQPVPISLSVNVPAPILSEPPQLALGVIMEGVIVENLLRFHGNSGIVIRDVQCRTERGRQSHSDFSFAPGDERGTVLVRLLPSKSGPASGIIECMVMTNIGDFPLNVPFSFYAANESK